MCSFFKLHSVNLVCIMEVFRLDDEELEYELKIRGYSVIDDRNVMRNLLRGLIKTGENNLENYVIQNPENEISICTSKLRELKNFIDKINDNKYSDNYRTADTKLSHLLGRIDRITTTDPKLLKSRSILLKTILYLMREMETRTSVGAKSNALSIPQYNITPGTVCYIHRNNIRLIILLKIDFIICKYF